MQLTNIKLRLKGGAIMPLKYVKSFNAKSGNNDGEDIDFDDLTPEQQMEIRKNLGLYYEETSVEEKTVSYDGQQEEQYAPGRYKISDDTPSIEDIIKVSDSNENEVIINITDGSHYHQIYSQDNVLLFQVILQNIPGQTAGIYCTSNSKTMQLVYKGETTIVSKIDAKFLPEQEGGAIEPVTLLQVPTESATIVRSDYISDEDWDRLVNGETCVARYNNPLVTEHRYFLVAVNTSTVGTISATTAIFYCGNNTFTIQQFGTTCQITVPAINGIYDISAFPTAGMSSAELEAIGFKNQDLVIFGTEIKSIRCVNNNGTEIATIISSYSFSMNYNIEFWTKDNKYVLSGSLMASDLTCTVTPR